MEEKGHRRKQTRLARACRLLDMVLVEYWYSRYGTVAGLHPQNFASAYPLYYFE
jgi:hypothetical protein